MGLKMKRLIDTCVYFNRSLGKLPLPAPPAPPPGGGSVPGGACHADRLSSELRRGLPPPAGLSPESSTVTLGRTWPGPQPAPPQPCTVCGHAGGGRRGGHHARHGPDPCHARTCPLFSERPRASTLASTPPLTWTIAAGSKDPRARPAPSPSAHTVVWPEPGVVAAVCAMGIYPRPRRTPGARSARARVLPPASSDCRRSRAGRGERSPLVSHSPQALLGEPSAVTRDAL